MSFIKTPKGIPKNTGFLLNKMLDNADIIEAYDPNWKLLGVFKADSTDLYIEVKNIPPFIEQKPAIS